MAKKNEFCVNDKNTSLSIFFSGRNANVTVSTIRYMPLVIHLG